MLGLQRSLPQRMPACPAAWKARERQVSALELRLVLVQGHQEIDYESQASAAGEEEAEDQRG